MFSAKYFTYNGRDSGEFGLILSDFDTNSVIETDAFSPNIQTIKPAGSKRLLLTSKTMDTSPQLTFSMVKDSIIPDMTRRAVLEWLLNPKDFAPLTFHEEDFEEYTYMALVSNIHIIYVNGYCHGFRVTMVFDSQYARTAPVIVETTPGVHNVTIDSLSDIKNEYVYPIIEFNGNITVTNITDGWRTFEFRGISPEEHVIVDNEIKYIETSSGLPRIANFNKNWLRLLPGHNELEVTAYAGNVKIICPSYVTLGF